MWSRQWGLSITRTLVFWLDLSAPPLVRTNLCLRQSVSHVAVSLPSHDIVLSFSSLSVRNFFNCTNWQLVEYGRLQCIHALKQNPSMCNDSYSWAVSVYHTAENFQGRKLSQFCGDLQILSFLLEIQGRGILWHHNWTIYESFLCKNQISINLFPQKFSTITVLSATLRNA